MVDRSVSDLTGRQRCVDAFIASYGAAPEFVVRAPGRVNLIGEHTDYNDGFVLPMALPHATWIAAKIRYDQHVDIDSEGFGRTTFHADAPYRSEREWPRYMHGMAWALAEAGHEIVGFEGTMASDIPIGASLSSSAALMIGTALAFSAAAQTEWQPVEAARLAQVCENEWVGIPSGIMDQLISATATAGHATLIDCRSLALDPHPLPGDTRVVVLNTLGTRELVESQYAARRATCEAVAAKLGVTALRDAALADLDRVELSDTERARATHVITENQRTLDAAAAMSTGDGVALGALMNASHRSLRDDYEVSGPELDAIVDAARQAPGSLGARMTGGGFAGCAVALVEANALDAFMAATIAGFAKATGITAELYLAEPAAGASLAWRDPETSNRSVPGTPMAPETDQFGKKWGRGVTAREGWRVVRQFLRGSPAARIGRRLRRIR